MRVHAVRKKLNSPRVINVQGMDRSGDGGGEPLLCDHESEIRLGGGKEKRRAKIMKGKTIIVF